MHEITAQSRLRDALPELIPTSLARELTNHYPREVLKQPDRLATLAAELLQRERRATANERTARQVESRVLRDRLRQLELELAAARERSAELERRVDDHRAAAEKHLVHIVARVRRFQRHSRASKRSLMVDVTRLAEASLAAMAPVRAAASEPVSL